jgi:putative ABC transport system substrate-binding protein
MPGTARVQRFARVLRDGLATLGWVEGDNIEVQYRLSTDHLDSEAADLVAANPEVIVSGGTQATAALKEVTQTIPIVFVHVLDPLSAGLVQSLARPGGNMTGFASYESSIGGKWLELLKEIAPRTDHVLVLAGQNPTWRMHVPSIESAARALAVQLTLTHVDDGSRIAPAIVAFDGKANRGLIVLPDVMLERHRDRVVALAAEHRLPAIYGLRSSVGGELLLYTSDWEDLYRRAASYVDQILKGTKPGGLPVQEPTKFELVVNLETAKALGSPSRLRCSPAPTR